MNSHEKKIHGLKQKNRELTETKMIFKPIIKDHESYASIFSDFIYI
jgi:hypothetical protein